MSMLWQSLWFLLPAGAANMAPVFAAKAMPALAAPVDGGLEIRGRRLFGDHKTWRGIAVGILASTIVFAVQKELSAQAWAKGLSWIDYASAPMLTGPLLGMGALGGDLVKSFVKRQLDIAPGRSWIPFDQIDWLIGLLLVASILSEITAAQGATVLLVGTILHFATKIIGSWLHLHREWI